MNKLPKQELVDTIREWMKTQLFSTDLENKEGCRLSWYFRLPPGIRFSIVILESENGCNLTLEATVARVKRHLRAEILAWVVEENEKLRLPIRTLVNEQGIIILRYSNACESTSSQEMTFLLETFGPLATRLTEELYNRFGLVPISSRMMPAGWRE